MIFLWTNLVELCRLITLVTEPIIRQKGNLFQILGNWGIFYLPVLKAFLHTTQNLQQIHFSQCYKNINIKISGKCLVTNQTRRLKSFYSSALTNKLK